MSEQPSRSEVEELRAEVERLKSQVGPEPTVALPVERTRQGWWRPVVVVVLLVLVGLLTPLAVVATWAHDEISDTDRYVSTVAPLAKSPAVQRAVTDRITTEITSRLQVQAVTQQAVDALAARGLPAGAAASLQALASPLTNAINDFVQKQVAKLVASDQFAQAWQEANRQAHAQMVLVLTGKSDGTVQVSGDKVSVNLSTVINSVKQTLVDQGFELAAKLPTIQAEFTIFQSSDLAKAQNGFRWLSAIARVLPILALACLLGAVAVGRSRRRTLVAGSLVVALSVLLLGVSLNFFRVIYLDAVPTDQLPTDAAGAIFDQLVWFIRLNVRALLVLSLVIAFIAWVTGPDAAPSAVRRGTSSAIGVVRSGGQRAGLDTGPVGVFLETYKKVLRIAVLAIALLVYVLQSHPTGASTIWLVVIAAVVLLVIELLARPAVLAAETSSTPPAPGPS